MRVADLTAYVAERLAIRERRALGLPGPWTTDPILRDWKFTNVKRAWDRTTQQIGGWVVRTHELAPLNLALARFVNWLPTLEAVGYQTRWAPDQIIRAMAARAAQGQKVWGSAYMVHCRAGVPSKAHYIVGEVLTRVAPLLTREQVRAHPSAASFHRMLRAQPGFADFMAQEVLQDILLFSEPDVAHWPDRDTFAVAGPGALRGLNRVYVRPLRQPVPQAQAQAEMQELQRLVHVPGLSLTVHDVEFNLCEFDKYERVRLGQGHPRARFVPILTTTL